MNEGALPPAAPMLGLGIALAIGLLIGTERGWHGMHADKPHLAGLRTFGLLGLLGGVTGLVARELGQPVFGLALLAVAAALVAVYVAGQEAREKYGVTSLIAALLTFALGVLASMGQHIPAAAAAVVASLLLGFKPVLHRWVAGIEEAELRATLKLLLISVVLLPVLPDRGYGPGDALNPRQVWWMVVLVAAISYSGYFAVKAAGTRRGLAVTSVLAGLASSTALTLHLARLARREGAEANLLAAGILLATLTLFPRVLVIAAVLHRELAAALLAPMATMALVVLLPGLRAWRHGGRDHHGEDLKLKNPLELGSALRFGALLAAVLVLAQALAETFGGTGVLALGALSGVADLNAITLSMGRMSGAELPVGLAAAAVVVAAVTNSCFKAALAWGLGGARLGLRVAVPVLAAAAAGPLALWASGTWPGG